MFENNLLETVKCLVSDNHYSIYEKKVHWKEEFEIFSLPGCFSEGVAHNSFIWKIFPNIEINFSKDTCITYNKYNPLI